MEEDEGVSEFCTADCKICGSNEPFHNCNSVNEEACEICGNTEGVPYHHCVAELAKKNQ